MAPRTVKASSSSATLKMEQKLLASKTKTQVVNSPESKPKKSTKTSKAKTVDVEDDSVQEKKTRVPSAYNIFVKDNMTRVKAENPDVPHRECMGLVAALWQKQKPADAPQTKPKKPRAPKVKKSDDGSSGSDTEKLKKQKRAPSAYNKHIGEAIKRLRADQPGLPSTDYMKLAIAEWKVLPQEDKPVSEKKIPVKKEPKHPPSKYNLFVRDCMQKLRVDQPGLPSTDYMRLAVAEWQKQKATAEAEPEAEEEVVESEPEADEPEEEEVAEAEPEAEEPEDDESSSEDEADQVSGAESSSSDDEEEE